MAVVKVGVGHGLFVWGGLWGWGEGVQAVEHFGFVLGFVFDEAGVVLGRGVFVGEVLVDAVDAGLGEGVGGEPFGWSLAVACGGFEDLHDLELAFWVVSGSCHVAHAEHVGFEFVGATKAEEEEVVAYSDGGEAELPIAADIGVRV